MVAEKINLAQPVNRCPFCHDDVQTEEAVACRDCLARHHTSCWDEGAGCSSCSGTVRLETPGGPRLALTPKRATELLLAEGYSPAEVRELLVKAKPQLPGLIRFLAPPFLFATLFPLLGLVFEVLGGNLFHNALPTLFLSGLAAGVLYSIVAAAARLKWGPR